MKVPVNVAFIILFSITASGAITCSDLILTSGTSQKAPTGADTLALVKTSDGTVLKSLALDKSNTNPPEFRWNPSPADLTALRDLAVQNGLANVVLRWSSTTSADKCDAKITFAEDLFPTQTTGSSTGVAIGASSSDCRKAAEDWNKKLARTRPDGRYTIIVLDDTNNVCYKSRNVARAAFGDPIYVGVFTTDAVTWSTPQFTPCDLKSAEPSFNAPSTGTGVFDILSGRQGGGRVLLPQDGPPDPVSCFNPNVEIRVEGQRNDTKAAAVPLVYNLRQYPRYNFTIQLGIGTNSKIHDEEFGLKPSNGTNVIFSKGPKENGPEYTVDLLIYALPRYFTYRRATGDFYPGRDVVHDVLPADRVGLLLGAGLKSPGSEFHIGLAYEVISPGVNLTWTYGWRKHDELAAGFKEGDPFTGTEADIPLTTHWRHESVVGVSIDLGYAIRLFRQ